MGSSDESKPSLLSEALILPRPSSVDPEEYQSYPPISYNSGHRPLRDLPFLLLFLLLSLATFVLGILAAVRRNPDSSSAASFVYDLNSSSCVRLDSAPNFLFLSSSASPPFLVSLISTLFVTLFLSVPVVLALLWLFCRFAKQIVYFSLPFFILTPSFLNVYWFVACTLNHSCSESFPLAYRILVLIFIFLIIAVFLWIIIANWNRIELTVQIVRVAAAALASNINLLAVLPALGLGLAVYLAPIIVFLVFARLNGSIVPKEGSDGWYYCVWKQERWVPAYYALAIITMIWSFAVMVEAQVYVISGTIAQWYFAMEDTKPTRSIRSSLRNAFGPSFGTVCFSGMVMGAIRVVRAILDNAKREDTSPGCVNILLQCCANFLLSAFDFVNKFTINFASITGEAYCSAAKMTYELLKRNLLSAVFVETVSTRILIGIIFVISALYAIAVCAILKAVVALGVESYYVAALAFLLLLVILWFFVNVLDNVIDAIYVCYAIDRDKGEVCKPEVHEVYTLLPISRNHGLSITDSTPLIV